MRHRSRMLPLFILIFSSVGFVNCLKCSRVLTVNQTGEIGDDNVTLSSGNYTFGPGYYESINSSHYSVCICTVKPCLRKCCPIGQIYLNMNCKDSKHEFKPILYDYEEEEMPEDFAETLHFAPGITCPGFLTITNYVGVGWNESLPLLDGNLLLPNYSYADHLLFKPDEFCLESFEYMEDQVLGPVPFLCYPKAAAASYPISFIIGMIISIIALLLTLLVYAILPELQNLHGKSLMCHIAAFTAGFIGLAVSRLGPSQRTYYHCFAMGTSIAYSTLAAFFWLSIMSFDIWYTFSARGFTNKTSAEEEKKKFIIYSIYAWGMPLLVLLITFAIDHIPHLPSFIIKPKFGVGRCWYNGQKAKLIYYFGPIGILLTCNIIFFGVTAFNLLKARRQTSGLRKRRGGSGGDVGRNSENWQRFALYMKLFLVMGLNWILEVIVQLTNPPFKVWYIPNLFNCLQGFVIFIIFVCKTRIKDQLLVRYRSTIKSETRSTPWHVQSAKHIASTGVVTTVATYKPKKEIQP